MKFSFEKVVDGVVCSWFLTTLQVKFSGLWIPSLLYADDVVLLASSNSDL